MENDNMNIWCKVLHSQPPGPREKNISIFAAIGNSSLKVTVFSFIVNDVNLNFVF